MSRRYCIYKTCRRNKTAYPDLTFFRFPVKDVERCRKWCINAGREDLLEINLKTLGSRVICSHHFADDAYRCSRSRKLLRPEAVPTLTGPPSVDADNVINTDTENVRYFGQSESDDEKGVVNPEILQETTTTAANLIESCKIDSDQDSLGCFSATVPDPEVCSTSSDDAGGSELMTVAAVPRKRKFQRRIRWQNILFKRKGLKLKQFQSDNLGENVSENCRKATQNSMSTSVSVFIGMQLKSSSRVSWTSEEKKFALYLHYKSPELYKDLPNKGFHLPSVGILQRWLCKMNLNPGFNQVYHNLLRDKVQSMTKIERECIVSFSEIPLNRGFTYNVAADIIEGHQDLGSLGRTKDVASHALIFMACGLLVQWNHPICYFLSNGSIESSSLEYLINSVLSEVEAIGLIIRAIVCNQNDQNMDTLKEMGVSEIKPFIMCREKKLYFLFDIAHLFKSILFNLKNNDFKVGKSTVSWQCLKDLCYSNNEKLKHCTALQLCKRLINLKSFSEIRAYDAMQVFSSSVSQALFNSYISGNVSDDAAFATSTFFKEMNDLFDICNSTKENEIKLEKCALSICRPELEVMLVEKLEWLSTITLGLDIKDPPCFSGIRQTVSAIVQLWSDLKNEGHKFLLTGRLNKNFLESVCSIVGEQDGRRCDPSAAEMRRVLQRVAGAALLSASGLAYSDSYKNTLWIPSEHDVNDSLEEKQSLSSDLISGDTEEEEIDAANTHSISVRDYEVNESAVMYYAKYLAYFCLQKFGCVDCKERLLRGREQLESMREALISNLLEETENLNNEACFVGMYRPSKELVNVIRHQLSSFSNEFPHMHAELNVFTRLKDLIKQKTREIYPTWLEEPCIGHREFILDKLIIINIKNQLIKETERIQDYLNKD